MREIDMWQGRQPVNLVQGTGVKEIENGFLRLLCHTQWALPIL